MSNAKAKNPLYVVTNDGKDVESATNLFDMLVKKFGLEPLMQIFKSIVDMISGQVGNYGFFLFLQDLVDQFVAILEDIRSKVSLFVPGLK